MGVIGFTLFLMSESWKGLNLYIFRQKKQRIVWTRTLFISLRSHESCDDPVNVARRSLEEPRSLSAGAARLNELSGKFKQQTAESRRRTEPDTGRRDQGWNISAVCFVVVVVVAVFVLWLGSTRCQKNKEDFIHLFRSTGFILHVNLRWETFGMGRPLEETHKVIGQTFSLSHSRRTNLIFYCQLSLLESSKYEGRTVTFLIFSLKSISLVLFYSI